MKKLIILALLAFTLQSTAQVKWSEKVAATVDKIWPDSLPIGSQSKWSYDMGVVLKGFESLWMRTGDVRYYNSLKSRMD